METKIRPKLKDAAECTGCGACIAVCPKLAINKKIVGFGSWIPEINVDFCVNCGRCEKVCKGQCNSHKATKNAYIAYNRDSVIRKESASGGAFSALATYILNNGGVVFGAELHLEKSQVHVEHSMIKEIKDLSRLLGSKYVQSDCTKAYNEVKIELQLGKIVLFSGCSCQIAGLKNYLGDINQTNLYTIDLICHGVPGIDFLNNYVQFLEKKYNGEITDLSFRAKENNKIIYRITAKIIGLADIKIPLRESGYFRMFMGEESYREACYKCPYASLEKPADITVGDYFEAQEDYPRLFAGENGIDTNGGISCLITHNDRGKYLLKNSDKYLFLHEVEVDKVQASHGNLKRPSRYTKLRAQLYKQYCAEGYEAIERYYRRRNALVTVPKAIVSFIRECINRQ